MYLRTSYIALVSEKKNGEDKRTGYNFWSLDRSILYSKQLTVIYTELAATWQNVTMSNLGRA